ncbi:aminopeptidase [Micromonospora endophytica]|uniref:Aminopeptidase n=1 Tax=Micromonospora endophytica TaxID=515350 RepID=A0A2W2CF51_9ACTN|nr:aminopeptidase [Micromonospora endophytica]RIW47871.1 M20/M25/M40 family metallo-hydrolase [Micromonospora endophytica]BCJ62227.1 hydrolase [Micromonospora endophytica]
MLRVTSVLRAFTALTLTFAAVAVVPATTAAATAQPTAPQPTALAVPDISLTNTKAHLQQFQAIANANGGNRRSTTAGYTASVTYVFDRLVAAGFTVTRQNCTSGCTSGAGPNVIADWPGGGDPNSVYMFGAHLDGVSAGPGINDNASGSATLLEIALTLAATNPSLTSRVRFAFWTDEEQGLNGSRFYANNLPSMERAKIKAYFNFDMVGSTNGGYFINRITSAPGQTLKAYYDSIGVQTEENTEGAGRSDDAPFNAIGVQTSGVAAGASRVKTAAQVAKWGGTQSAFDPCYHRACDTYPSNISDTVLNRAGDAAAYALWTLAAGTPATVVWSDTFETATGWTTNPAGTDTATLGLWERGVPQATNSSGAKQLAATISGTNDLVTGRLAGTSAGDYDIDGGTTSVRSPAITLPATGPLTLKLSWYLAHGSNATSADFFRVSVVHNGGTTALFTQPASATNRDAAWASGSWSLTSYAGQSVRILVEAADAGTASLVEAAVDDVVITQG